MVGLVAGFLGVVVLIGAGMVGEIGTNVLAELACLGAAYSYGFVAVYARRLRGLSPIVVATGQLTMSTVLLAPVVILFDRPSALLTASSAALWSMVSLALFSTALAYLIPSHQPGRRDQRLAGDVPHSDRRNRAGLVAVE